MYVVYLFWVHVGAEVIFTIENASMSATGMSCSFEIHSMQSLALCFSFRQNRQVTLFELGTLPLPLDEVSL
jgi:hypothetical protein